MDWLVQVQYSLQLMLILRSTILIFIFKLFGKLSKLHESTFRLSINHVQLLCFQQKFFRFIEVIFEAGSLCISIRRWPDTVDLLTWLCIFDIRVNRHRVIFYLFVQFGCWFEMERGSEVVTRPFKHRRFQSRFTLFILTISLFFLRSKVVTLHIFTEI